tara:strand:+ start:17 stop:127 length:111 start_codon:yes stop_codon:yes gene_type:complete
LLAVVVGLLVQAVVAVREDIGLLLELLVVVAVLNLP